MELKNSKRLLYTANFVSRELTTEEQRRIVSKPSKGIKKVNFIRSLRVSPAAIGFLRERLANEENEAIRASLSLFVSVNERIGQSAANVELIATAAKINDEHLLLFAGIIYDKFPKTEVNFALEMYRQQIKIAPIGMLHLERIEMYPVGLERGEMVFTVPLAPGESTTISHKEWASTAQEFQEIISDQFESYSEKGVAEKTDASMSTENEARHSDALNFNATLAGGYGPVSMTTSLGLTNTDEQRKSIKQSQQTNREITEKSTARARKEHKISIKLESKKGVEDNSFRTISNPSTTSAMRVDYYRLMRKWKTDLFRYGLRLTYDITIPRPGIRLLARHYALKTLDEEISKPFVFALKPEDINEANYRSLAADAGAGVETPPAEYLTDFLYQEIQELDGDQAKIHKFRSFLFEVPGGYEVLEAALKADVVPWPHPKIIFHVLDGSAAPFLPNNVVSQIPTPLHFLVGQSGRCGVPFEFLSVSMVSARLELKYRRKNDLFFHWQSKTWAAIKAAKFAQVQEENAKKQEKRNKLWMELTGKDTLSLRRLEREELVRLVMQWLIGPHFPSSPKEISNPVLEMLVKEINYINSFADAPGISAIDPAEYNDIIAFGDFVKYIHQAVEWENILYFMYPYFWGSEYIGRDLLLFDHIDPEHRNFLRAGYARVVITIRPGFEKDFTRLVETGFLSKDYDSPYMPIAAEIERSARTNYSNIPPANPEKNFRPLLYSQQRKTWSVMESVVSLIEDHYLKHNVYPADLGELPGGPFKDAWDRDLIYQVPGASTDYDLISYGANGIPGGEGLDADIYASAEASLIATWYNYSPTSGIDIEVGTPLADGA